jgi:hypothetical protein
MSGMNAGIYRRKLFGRDQDLTAEQLEKKLMEHYKLSLKKYPSRLLKLRGYAKAEQLDPVPHNMKQVRYYYNSSLGHNPRRARIPLTEEKKRKLSEGAKEYRNAWNAEKKRITQYISTYKLTDDDVPKIWNDKNNFTQAQRKQYYAEFRANWRATHPKKIYPRKLKAKAPAKKKVVKKITTKTKKAPAKKKVVKKITTKTKKAPVRKGIQPTIYSGYKVHKKSKKINEKIRPFALEKFLKVHAKEAPVNELKKLFTQVWNKEKHLYRGQGVAMI